MRAAFVIAAVLALAACSGSGAGPAGTSADEDRQLNDAAAALDANSAGQVPSPSNGTAP